MVRKGSLSEYIQIRELCQHIMKVKGKEDIHGLKQFFISEVKPVVKNKNSIWVSKKELDSAYTRILKGKEKAMVSVDVDLFKYKDNVAFSYVPSVSIEDIARTLLVHIEYPYYLYPTMKNSIGLEKHFIIGLPDKVNKAIEELKIQAENYRSNLVMVHMVGDDCVLSYVNGFTQPMDKYFGIDTLESSILVDLVGYSETLGRRLGTTVGDMLIFVKGNEFESGKITDLYYGKNPNTGELRVVLC